MNETHNNTEDNKRIAKNTLFLYIRLAFVLVISLYTSRVVLRTLGVVDYGIYNVVAGFVSMFALLNTSLTNAAQRFYNYEKGQNGETGVQKVFITTHYIQIIIAVLIFILAETLGLWYVLNKMVYPAERALAVHIVYQASVVALLFVVLQIPYSAAIIAHERINYFAIVGVLDVILKLIVALIVPLFGIDNLSIYGVLIAGIALVDFLLYYVYARKKFVYLRFKKVFYKSTFNEMVKFSGWSAFNSFSQVIRHQGLNLLVNFFFGPVVNAAHGIAYQVKSALLGFVMNITTASQPQIVESYAVGNYDRTKQLMYTVSKFIFLSLYIVALPIMVEADYVLRLWLGNDIPQYTVIFTVLVLITTLIDILNAPISTVVSASGRVGAYNFWTSIIGISVLPIAYVFLKNGANPVSVYLVSLFSSIIMQLVCMIIMQRVTKLQFLDYSKNVLLPMMLVVVITFYIPCFIVREMNGGFLRLLIVLIVSVLAVMLTGYYLGLNKRERTFIVSSVQKVWVKITKR